MHTIVKAAESKHDFHTTYARGIIMPICAIQNRFHSNMKICLKFNQAIQHVLFL